MRPALWLLAVLALLSFLPGLAQIPVTDRDEARFAQASRQMALSGDLVDIRLGADLRMKKPVGIYWAQAAVARLFGEGPQSSAPLWAYRLPSTLGAVLAVVLTAMTGALFFGARVGLWGAALLAVTLVVSAEARIAKTDAALLASLMAAIYPLARAYLRRGLTRWHLYGFWLALAAMVLIKGPIGLLLLGFLVLGARVSLRPLLARGPIAVALIVALPWFFAITWRYGMGFWQGSVGVDLLPKLAAGQEGKGAPFGTYLALIWLSFWPASALLPLALRGVWAARATTHLRFFAAWVVPFWLVLELVPTKLLHYPMLSYPALAILVAAYAGQGVEALRKGSALSRWAILGLASLAALIGPVLAAALWSFGRAHGALPADLAPLALAGAASALAVLALLWALMRGADRRLLPLAALSGALLWAGLYPSLARIDALWPSDQAFTRAQTAARAQGCTGPMPLAAIGYSEPSLLWLGGAGTRFIAPDAPLPPDLRTPCALILRVSTAALPQGCSVFDHVEGLALGAGKWLRLDLLRCEAVR